MSVRLSNFLANTLFNFSYINKSNKLKSIITCLNYIVNVYKQSNEKKMFIHNGVLTRRTFFQRDITHFNNKGLAQLPSDWNK